MFRRSPVVSTVTRLLLRTQQATKLRKLNERLRKVGNRRSVVEVGDLPGKSNAPKTRKTSPMVVHYTSSDSFRCRSSVTGVGIKEKKFLQGEGPYPHT